MNLLFKKFILLHFKSKRDKKTTVIKELKLNKPFLK